MGQNNNDFEDAKLARYGLRNFQIFGLCFNT